MLTLLKSLIVSQVEYACVIWSPIDQQHINLIEGVQRKFTSRFVCFQTYDDTLGMPVCTTDYATRLQQLKIYNLQRRRERYIIIYVYKIVNKLTPNPGFDIDYNPRLKLEVTPKLVLQRGNANWSKKARNSSFFVTGPRLYNSIPGDLRELEDNIVPSKSMINSFKRKLDKHLSTIPDLPGTSRNSLLPNLQ